MTAGHFRSRAAQAAAAGKGGGELCSKHFQKEEGNTEAFYIRHDTGKIGGEAILGRGGCNQTGLP